MRTGWKKKTRSITWPRPFSNSTVAGKRNWRSLLEAYADAVFLAAVEQFQVFHFLVFHGEEEEAGDRLFDLLLGQHLGVEELLERVLLLALLRAGFDAGVLRAGVHPGAAAHSHAADTPTAAALRALTAGAAGASEDEPATAGDLAGRH